MRVSRNELATHLRRVHVGGEILEAVFRPDLSATAVTTNHSFMVDVPAGPGDLPEAVGVIDLGMVVQAVELGASEETTLDVRDDRLVLDEGELGSVSYLRAPPDGIGTTVRDEARERFLGASGPAAPLEPQLVDRVVKLQDLLGALEIRLDCGPDGTTWLIGAERSHHATYRQESLQTDGEEYSLVLRGYTLPRVLKLLPEGGRIVLTGPDSIVKIEFGDHTYMMNPMNP